MGTAPPSWKEGRARLQQLSAEIASAIRRSGRQPGSVRVVAIGKTYPVEALQEIYEVGHRCFGENRVQEAAGKIPALPGDVEWHLVGHLQSNKARRAGELFHWVHSLDSERTALRLAKGAVEGGRQVSALVS